MAKEVAALGYTPKAVQPTGVLLSGTMADCIRLNLHLRCGSQVLFSLKKFICHNPDELYRQVKKIAWETIIHADGYLSVNSNVYHPTIRTDMFASVKVKDAIVDRIRDQTGKRPDTGPTLEGAVVYLYWKDSEAEIFADTSGDTLAKHGYRKIPGKAPMLEALAAAVLLATNWQGHTPFVNPMCGSGTLAIEAALLATNRYPGLLRQSYGFMHLQQYDSEVYKTELATVKEKINTPENLEIIATDISRDAIEIARVNAGLAQVEDLITWEECDFAATKVPQGMQGVIVFNPEYGERLGQLDELNHTYARIGDFLKQQCKGYKGFIFTGNLELAKKIGLRASSRTELYNGKIDCRLLQYELYEGTRRPAAP